MTDYRRIHPKRYAARFPIVGTAVIWLLLDRFGASDLVHGIVWTVVGLVWVGTAVNVALQELTDPFEQER